MEFGFVWSLLLPAIPTHAHALQEAMVFLENCWIKPCKESPHSNYLTSTIEIVDREPVLKTRLPTVFCQLLGFLFSGTFEVFGGSARFSWDGKGISRSFHAVHVAVGGSGQSYDLWFRGSGGGRATLKIETHNLENWKKESERTWDVQINCCDFFSLCLTRFA